MVIGIMQIPISNLPIMVQIAAQTLGSGSRIHGFLFTDEKILPKNVFFSK